MVAYYYSDHKQVAWCREVWRVADHDDVVLQQQQQLAVFAGSMMR